MRAADAAALPPEERPYWCKPRKRGRGAGESRTLIHDVQLSDYAVRRLKKAARIRKRLDTKGI